MSENFIKLSYVDYITLISGLSLIKKINKCISSVSRNYIHTSMIDSDIASDIMVHYDRWIETTEVEEDFEKDLQTLVKDVIEQSTQNLVKSISTIPKEHFGTSHPKFELLKTKEIPLHESIMEVAEVFVNKHFQTLEITKKRLIETSEQLTDKHT